MLRTGRVIAAVCLGATKPRLQWSAKNGKGSLTIAAIATKSWNLQSEAAAFNEQLKRSLCTTEDVSTTQDVREIIRGGVNGSSSKAFKIIQVLSDLVDDKKINFKDDVEKDKNFGILLDVIKRDTDLRYPSVVITGLKNLLKLGISDDAHVIQCVENRLLWNVRKVSVPVLLAILSFQIDHQNTDLQRKVVKETRETIQRRWVEIHGPKEIQLIYPHHQLFSLEFLGHIDDRTIELAEDMKYTELCGIFCALGTAGRRATPVLRALAYHMAKQEDKLPPKQLSNILFAMHSLSFPDQVLLEKIGNDLIPQVGSINNSAVVGSILSCMGQMRWRDTNLLEALSEWIENNFEICRPKDLVSIVLTLACVAYTPTNADTLFELIIPNLNTSSIDKENIWLDVVWSLAILGRATEDHVSSVLNPSFVLKITKVSKHLNIGIRLKLLNISAVAKLMMPSYCGPHLNLAEYKDIIITQSRNELMLTKHVQTMLRNFFPPPKYMRENIQTSLGIFVASELAVNMKGKPIPIQDYSDNFGESKGLKPLPEGAAKIALFVWDFKDYTIGSQKLIGVNQFAVQVMEKIGHKVVQVPFFEYNMKAKTLSNIQYLENKIKEVIS